MPTDHARRREPSGEARVVSFRAPDLLRASLLLLLYERGDYGYELRTRLVELSGMCCDHGTVYRVLNQMEDEGLVSSGWERSRSGPARRRYRLTASGEERLDASSGELARLSRVLSAFETRYRDPQRQRQQAVQVPGQPAPEAEAEQVPEGEAVPARSRGALRS